MEAVDQQDLQGVCPNCTKAGLPLLPLRYAVARGDALVKERAPSLRAPFGAGVEDIPLPAELAHYTLRTLRSGYLYVFNEARASWSSYEVEEDGTLLEFPFLDKSPPQNEDEIREVCSRHGNPDIAKCIMIKDAHNAAAVWLAFTCTAWTPDVKKKHTDQAFREQHMRRIDVGEWVRTQGAQVQAHLGSLELLTELVGEYAMPDHSDAVSGEDGLEYLRREIENRKRMAEWRMRHEQAKSEGRADEVSRPITDEERVVVRGVSYPALDFSLVDFHNRAVDAESFLLEARQAGLRGMAVAGSQGQYLPAMVALSEPAGVTMDLASLMSQRLRDFHSTPEIKRPLAIAATIGALEVVVKTNAQREVEKDVQDRAERKLLFDTIYPSESAKLGVYGGGSAVKMDSHDKRMLRDTRYAEEWRKKCFPVREQALANVTVEELDAAAQTAWKKYTKKLRDGEPERWRQQTYQQALQEFDAEVLIPLAEIHVAWLTSLQLAAHMRCNHDSKDPASGAGYSDTLLLCLQDTQTNAICAAQYSKWLGAAAVSEENLLLRGMALNQDAVVELLAAGKDTDWVGIGGLPWSTMLMGYERALGERPGFQQEAPVRLLAATAGPAMTAMAAGAQHPGAFVVLFGLIGRQPVISTRIRGTLDQAIDHLVSRMVRANPDLGRLDQERLRTRMRNQSKGKRDVVRARGRGMKGKNQIHIVVDQLALGDIKGHLSDSEMMRRAGRSVMDIDDWKRSALGRSRTMMEGAGTGTVALLLNVWSMYALANELDKHFAESNGEDIGRFVAAVASMVGAMTDVLHKVLENMKGIGSRLALRITRCWTRLIGLAGKALGLSAAVIFSICDLHSAWGQWRAGNYFSSVLYGASAVSGIVAYAALAGMLGPVILGLSATGFGLILVGLAVLVGALIIYFEDNNLQVWFRRCFFGREERGMYVTLEEELAELDGVTRSST